jgi:hypothetical protein
MARKKWTPQAEVTDDLLKFREKRKWQIALRRYVLEKQKCYEYAPYFGLDIASFRNWIEAQFDETNTWGNFSETWQFEHVVPVTYFDFRQPNDLRLCWNFTNIRVEKSGQDHNKSDVLAAKAYFKGLFDKTGYSICQKMVQKIEKLESTQVTGHDHLEHFIRERREYLDTLASFSASEYEKLNTGTPLDKITWEADFLRRFEQKDKNPPED